MAARWRVLLCVGAMLLGCDEGSSGESEAAQSEQESSAEIVVEDEETNNQGRVTNVDQGIVSTIEDASVTAEPDVTEVDAGETGELETIWDETQHLIMDTAMELYPTYKILHQYAVGPGCGPISGVCHNTKEYPDLHSSANMLDAVGLNCNVLIDGPAVTENVCERPADELIITSGQDVGFKSSIGTFIVTPQSVACGQDPDEVEAEAGEVCVPDPEGPTWDADVAAMIQAKCGNCHGTPPQNAPIALNTYNEIVKGTGAADVHRYDRVLARMEAQTMPPGGGNTDAEIQLVADWIDNCHTEAGEEVVENTLEDEPEDLCIQLKDPISNGMSDGELGVNFTILRKDPETAQNLILVEYEAKLHTEAGSQYVRFPGFSDLTEQERAIFLYSVITGDPNGDGVFGADSGEAGLLITPGDPEKSYFVWRMMGWGDAPQMPLAGEPLLPPAQLAVMCWIYNMTEPEDVEALDEIDYSTCYELLQHFEGVPFDPNETRNH